MRNRQVCLFLSLAAVFLAPMASLPGLFPMRAACLPQSHPQVTVAAAISMKDVLEAIASLYGRRKGAPDVTLTFGASGILEKQIEQGAPVDVFISAAPAQMNALEKQVLLLEGTRRDIAGNRLVLVVPRGTTVVHTLEDLKKPAVRTIAMGEPRAVPAGQYAAEALRHLGLFDALESKFVYAQDVRAVLTYVAGGDADAGFVYETDAESSGNVTIAAAAPAGSYTPVVYPAAVVRSSQNPTAAKYYLDYLSSAEARAMFEKYGFTTPAK
ncbi:MAG TPA: molybdate ABC transporter substrate-binding protein [Candidatus Acidoferrales bacterium]|nr:molybdate ABC transporter substrate-binding protein [Candidatus Acidoferrales bacterium]